MLIHIRAEQTSFVEGRNIIDNIIVVQEMIYSMKALKGSKKWKEVKIDLEKAYDCMDWSFIGDTLEDACIPPMLIKVIMAGFSSSSFQVLWNGSPSEPFSPTRGVQ